MRSGHRRGKSVMINLNPFHKPADFSLRIHQANLAGYAGRQSLFISDLAFCTSADLLKICKWIGSAERESRTGSGVRASSLSGMLGGAHSGIQDIITIHLSLILSFFILLSSASLLSNSSWRTILSPFLSFPLP